MRLPGFESFSVFVGSEATRFTVTCFGETSASLEQRLYCVIYVSACVGEVISGKDIAFSLCSY